MKVNLKSPSLIGAFLFLGMASCKSDKKEETTMVNKEDQGIVLEYMDTLVKPSEDFFRYVNGTWLDNNEIPGDRTRWGSFDELAKKTDEDALAILKAAMGTNKDLKKIEVLPGSDQEKAVKLYETIMDTVSRDAQGVDPLKPYLAKI
ncbi:MAG: M13 family peptidase, partial [Mangrovimonas sp.]|nr:M13 family peptidase [Mangrovimonas sp.]